MCIYKRAGPCPRGLQIWKHTRERGGKLKQVNWRRICDCFSYTQLGLVTATLCFIALGKENNVSSPPGFRGF